MSDTVLVYGHSDDLIEVEGAISAEMSGPTAVESGVLCEFNTGDQLRVSYDGEWTIEQEGDLCSQYSRLEILEKGTSTIFNNYSDVAIYQSWDSVTDVEIVNE